MATQALEPHSNSGLARLRPIAPELQFWGYEIGNVFAALAGAGGLATLYASLDGAGQHDGLIARLMLDYPDMGVTLGLGLIVLALAVIGLLRRLVGLDGESAVADFMAASAGVGLIGFALVQGVDWITASAVCFVAGSALIRRCETFPVMLKLGGLLIAGGGLCLTVAGIGGIFGSHAAIAAFTALTGVTVAIAGLMTYRGGMFLCGDQGGLLGPLDRAVTVFLERVGEPAIFWVDADTKARAPLTTAMWARLPLRALLAAAALGSGTHEGFLLACACVLWGLGDAALGSLDAQ